MSSAKVCIAIFAGVLVLAFIAEASSPTLRLAIGMLGFAAAGIIAIVLAVRGANKRIDAFQNKIKEGHKRFCFRCKRNKI